MFFNFGGLNDSFWAIAIAGGLVTGGGFTSANYMDFYGLHEEEKLPKPENIEKTIELVKDLKDEMKGLDEADAPMHIEKLVDAAEAAYDAGMDVKEIMDMIEQHLGLKMGE